MSLRNRWRALRSRLAPGRRAWRGARHGVVLVAIGIFLAGVWPALAVPSFNWTALIPILLLPLVAFLAGGLSSSCSGLPLVVPASLPLDRGLGADGVRLPPRRRRQAGAVGHLALRDRRRGPRRRGARLAPRPPRRAPDEACDRAVTASSLGLGLLLLAFGLGWLLWDGPAEKPVPDAARSATAAVPPLALPDPGQPGPYAVRELTYGSGTDRHRPEFGAKAGLRSRSVDGSLLVERWKGALGWAREAYWGFDAKHLPLQGRVWYPEGEGPFPIVLMVHGNHQAEDFSDPGYEYLGRLFASRGTIAVSVDENFLNSTVSDLLAFPDGMSEENDARGWLLLEHLRQWREWNRTPGNPFERRVDLERVGLVGHSRGGEAVAVAGVFNRLPFYPDDARVAFDYGFGIRGVAAIAPVDGQYKPAGASTRLSNLSYFVLHGSHDGDMRVLPRRARLRARPLHRPGRALQGRPLRAPGQPRAVQHDVGPRRLGRARQPLPRPATAPAEGGPGARRSRLPVGLRRGGSARRDGLPRALPRPPARRGLAAPVVCLQQYEDSATHVLADYEEDIDLTTGTAPGARLRAENLADWKEREAALKWGSLDTRAVWLGWNREKAKATPSYALLLPEPGVEAEPDHVLAFHLADAKQEPSPPLDEEKPGKAPKDEAKKDETPKPIDLTVEIEDAAGRTGRLPLGRFRLLQPQIEAQVAKAAWLSDEKPSELVFDTFEIPLTAFRDATPGLDPSRLRAVRFLFDRTDKGVVVLDDLAIR